METVLSDYFVGVRATLDDVYKWDVPKNMPFGHFERGADSCAQANMRLRRFLSDIWKGAPDTRLAIAKWYVREWGGIKRNKDQTLERYVFLPETVLAASNLNGVATWSKILAVRNPSAYPIFDARVSASLAAIQFVKGIKNPVLFPQVASQNKKVRQFQKWLKHQDTEKVLTYRAYGDYVSLLDLVAKKSGLASPEAVEMILFANAETLIDQVVPNG